MKKYEAENLTKDNFLIVDNAIEYKYYDKSLLSQIFRINDLKLDDFKYEYSNATDPAVFEKILKHKNIIVSTSFTTIKSNAFEDLLSLAIKHNLKDKNILSLLPFKIVGSDFENYKPEIMILLKNDINFLFISSDNYSCFEGYDGKKRK